MTFSTLKTIIDGTCPHISRKHPSHITSLEDHYKEFITLGKKSNLYTIVVLYDILDPELWEDPKYMLVDYHILCDDIEAEARRRLENKWFKKEETDKIFQQYEWPRCSSNYKDDKEKDRVFVSTLKDTIFKAQTMCLYFEIIQQKIDLLYYEDFLPTKLEEYKTNKTDDKDEEDWLDEMYNEKYKYDEYTSTMLPFGLLKFFLPGIGRNNQRIIPLPEPFNYYDSRNHSQQFFIYLTDEGYMNFMGGDGSSGTREYQSLHSHVFHTLANEGQSITTDLIHIDYHNNVTLKHSYSDFLIRKYCSLSCNYVYHNEIHEMEKRMFPGYTYKEGLFKFDPNFCEEHGENIQNHPFSHITNCSFVPRPRYNENFQFPNTEYY